MPDRTVVHASPRPGSGTTPCCSRTPFELPTTDRMTLDPERATCDGTPSVETEETTGWFIEQGHQGRWSAMTEDYADRGEAVARLERRHAGCPGENLRLVRRDTTETRTIEEQREARS